MMYPIAGSRPIISKYVQTNTSQFYFKNSMQNLEWGSFSMSFILCGSPSAPRHIDWILGWNKVYRCSRMVPKSPPTFDACFYVSAKAWKVMDFSLYPMLHWENDTFQQLDSLIESPIWWNPREGTLSSLRDLKFTRRFPLLLSALYPTEMCIPIIGFCCMKRIAVGIFCPIISLWKVFDALVIGGWYHRTFVLPQASQNTL